MDSVSQAVLGAAVGEVVLGKKLGNKAVLWGALAGTIPDLDVITSPFLSEIDALIFHRGLSHSILFAALGGFGLGWLIHRLYNSNYYRNVVWLFLSLFISAIPISIVFFLFGQDDHRYYYTGLSIAVAALMYYIIQKRNASKPAPVIENPTVRSWQWMFFFAFLTHAILDCFTMYGTQLFLPFSNYRVAIASISVADPLGYTIPFLICIGIAMFFNRKNPTRQRWAWAGLILSSLYLVFTIWHKDKVFQEFDRQLKEQNIAYDRYVLGPYIFSNLLWSITVENEEKYYHASYSIFDTSPIQFLPIPKNHHLVSDGADDRTIKTLKHFTDGFYNVMERDDGKLQFNDLRFGTFRQQGDISDFIFRFYVVKEKPGKYRMETTIGGPEEESTSSVFQELYYRILGR